MFLVFHKIFRLAVLINFVLIKKKSVVKDLEKVKKFLKDCVTASEVKYGKDV